MRLALIALATLLLLTTACSDDSEEIDVVLTTPPTASAPSAGAVTFCHDLIGDGSTPTPVSSCMPPNANETSAPLDLRPRITDPPSTPPFPAVSDYLDFSAAVDHGPITFQAPITGAVPSGATLTFYQYVGGQWSPVQPAKMVGNNAQGTFNPLPPNLIVLAETP